MARMKRQVEHKDNRRKNVLFYIYFALAAASASVLLPRPAFAYLDPGTGSYVLQILIAAAVGAAVAIRAFWQNIKLYINKLFGGDKGGGGPPEDQKTDGR